MISKNEAELMERVAVLESKLVAQEEINKKVDLMLTKLNKYEGKLGGIFLVLGAMFTFLHLDPGKILSWLKSLVGG